MAFIKNFNPDKPFKSVLKRHNNVTRCNAIKVYFAKVKMYSFLVVAKENTYVLTR